MRRPHLLLLVAAGLIAVGLTYRLGGYPLLEPDEGRNAEVSREMAASNAFVLPRLNGLPYLDKPVLYFAAGAASQKVFGANAAAARLPSLVFTLLTLLVVALLARAMFGAPGAWVATVAAAAAPFTIAYARVVIFDSALTFFVTLALTAFFFAVEEPVDHGSGFAPSAARGWWGIIAWAAIGLAVLTKGPVALVFVGLVAVPYAAWRRRLRAVFEPAGMLTAVAVVLPWVLAVQQRVPDFLHYVVVVETAERLFTDRLGRSEPFWYFVPILLGAAFPWIVVALAGLLRPVRSGPASWDRRIVFLALWIVGPLLLFTLSRSKRPQYILPLVPAVAVLVAGAWHGARDRLPGTRAGAAALLLAGVALLATAARLPDLFDASAGVGAAIPRTGVLLGSLAVAGGLGALVFARHRSAVLLALSAPVAVIPIVGMSLMQAIGADRSSEALAAAMDPVLGAETEIVAVGTYPLSLPFYTRRTLTLVTEHGGELTSNYVVRNVDRLRTLPQSPLRPAAWWREALALCDRPRVFVVPVEARQVRDALATLPLLAEGRKVAAYGPCGRPDLAYAAD